MEKKKVITIEEFKEENTRLLQSMLAADGGFDPVVTGLIIRPTGEYGIAIFPLPKDAFESNESKRKIPLIMPKLFDSFRKQGITPVCFSFTSEAWLRTVKPEGKEIPENWKDAPKKEAFISSYETAEGCELHVNLIHREGKIANADGELIDAIRLERVPGMEKGPASTFGGNLMNMFHNELKKWKEDGKSTD